MMLSRILFSLLLGVVFLSASADMAPMILQQEKTADAGKEKHVPVVEKSEKGIRVKIGSVPHPMEEKHYLEWVEVRTGENVYVRGFKPGETPETEFCNAETSVKARAYCNVHGLWTNKI